MTPITPPTRPDISREDVQHFLLEARIPPSLVPTTYLLGRRGYYRDTMGVAGANDRGLYDDAIVLVTPDAVTAFNANTDPSRTRPGMATLATGLWRYRVGIHGLAKPAAEQYEALVQAGPVSVQRDGQPGRETGWFGINIHRGGHSTTGSEGCQTIVPEQWLAFIAAVEAAMRARAMPSIVYLLTERAAA